MLSTDTECQPCATVWPDGKWQCEELTACAHECGNPTRVVHNKTLYKERLSLDYSITNKDEWLAEKRFTVKFIPTFAFQGYQASGTT